MSQAKVDKYKQEKKNRKKIVAKQKRDRFLGSALFTLVILAFVGYIGYSVYDGHFKKDDKNTSTELATYSLSEEEVSSVWALQNEEETTTNEEASVEETSSEEASSEEETSIEETTEESSDDASDDEDSDEDSDDEE